jgi:hypothetical protein
MIIFKTFENSIKMIRQALFYAINHEKLIICFNLFLKSTSPEINAKIKIYFQKQADDDARKKSELEKKKFDEDARKKAELESKKIEEPKPEKVEQVQEPAADKPKKKLKKTKSDLEPTEEKGSVTAIFFSRKNFITKFPQLSAHISANPKSKNQRSQKSCQWPKLHALMRLNLLRTTRIQIIHWPNRYPNRPTANLELTKSLKL